MSRLVSAAIRRWLGSQTFAVSTGEPGLQIVDAQAARFGEFDDVQLVGLIDGEWPERFRRNVLVSVVAARQLEPLPVESPIRAGASATRSTPRARRSRICCTSPRSRVRVSTFVLENDAVVEPSILLDDIEAFGLVHARPRTSRTMRVFSSRGAGARAAQRRECSPGPHGRWADRAARSRLRRRAALSGRGGGLDAAARLGQPARTLSRLPVPFLRVGSAPARGAARRRGHAHAARTRAVSARAVRALLLGMADARASPHRCRVARRSARSCSTSICEEALATLSPAEATLERTRLLGSAVSPGIAHRVFAMEAERAERRSSSGCSSFRCRATFTSAALDGRSAPSRSAQSRSHRSARRRHAARDRLQVEEDARPQGGAAAADLQLVRARVARQATRIGSWALAEAIYLSFEGDQAGRAAQGRRAARIDELIARRAGSAADHARRIAEGHFPPQPPKKSCAAHVPYVERLPSRVRRRTRQQMTG